MEIVRELLRDGNRRRAVGDVGDLILSRSTIERRAPEIECAKKEKHDDDHGADRRPHGLFLVRRKKVIGVERSVTGRRHTKKYTLRTPLELRVYECYFTFCAYISEARSMAASASFLPSMPRISTGAGLPLSAL